MLEFIVLGQIPGTNIFLSFETMTHITAGLALFAAVLVLAKLGWQTELENFRVKQALILARTI